LLDFSARNIIMTAQQLTEIPLFSATHAPFTKVTSLTLSPSEGENESPVGDDFKTGVKRGRDDGKKGEEKKKKVRSEEARKRRKQQAKERYRNNKLRKKMEMISVNSPVKGAGERKKGPPPSGTSDSIQGQPSNAGKGKYSRTPQGSGNQPPQPHPKTKGGKAKGSKTQQDLKETSGPNPNPRNKTLAME